MGERLVTAWFLLLALLPLPLSHAIGKLLGLIFFLIPNSHRAISARNIALCFPTLSGWQRLQLLRRSLEETGKTIMEVPLIWCGSRNRVMGLVKQKSGEEAVREAMSSGRGMIAISPHIGCWEMSGLYLSNHYDITSMYRPPRYQSLAALMRHGRERLGAHLVPTDASGIKLLMQALKQGKMIGVLPDQDPRETGGVFAPFFGIPANTMTLLPKFAQKSGAAVIYCFAERLSWGRGFHLHFISAPGVGNGDVTVAATAVNAAVEECIRLAPAQYQWSYKRFRTRPAGEMSLYK
jgi:KDO2-lipid IV(A) lauroyltransferase